IERLPVVRLCSQEASPIKPQASVSLRLQSPIDIARAEQALTDGYRVVDADSAIVLCLFSTKDAFSRSPNAIHQGSAIVAQTKVTHVCWIARDRLRAGTIRCGTPDVNSSI